MEGGRIGSAQGGEGDGGREKKLRMLCHFGSGLNLGLFRKAMTMCRVRKGKGGKWGERNELALSTSRVEIFIRGGGFMAVGCSNRTVGREG